MGKNKKSKKLRIEFRKNTSSRARRDDLTRAYRQDGEAAEGAAHSERVSGKGDLSRRRTVVGQLDDDQQSTFAVTPEVDESLCKLGRVLSVHGLDSRVEDAQGKVYRCAVRQLLKSLSTDQRHIVATGDRVMFRVANDQEGIIERIEPRHGMLSRTSRGRQHVIVANIDQMLIVVSAAQPHLKPNLIDRMIIAAEKAEIRPVICINKVDLVDPADLQPLAGVYGQLGYDVLLLSATGQFGLQRLRALVMGKQTAVAGQSGVGKSSLLNAMQPGLDLAVREVSEENEKGKHTTTASRLIPLEGGGYLVDTPGIRQFQLWDVIPEEVAGYFRDLRPFVSHCRYPDCTHTHETDCAVKDAVAYGRIDARRYDSYCGVIKGADE
jgi:ribosome biogenesis GTPase / thiamine phosphate phosphatase